MTEQEEEEDFGEFVLDVQTKYRVYICLHNI